MKVYIDGKVYDANKTLIVLQLDDANKRHIAGMPVDYRYYAVFPAETRDVDARCAITAFRDAVGDPRPPALDITVVPDARLANDEMVIVLTPHHPCTHGADPQGDALDEHIVRCLNGVVDPENGA